ncbi:hypothetical protein MBN61_03375 [Candidatus Saccharibacteria bacterium]|nr:hypothetical protein [Candidatus Saccharibacteria bacterium]
MEYLDVIKKYLPGTINVVKLNSFSYDQLNFALLRIYNDSKHPTEAVLFDGGIAEPYTADDIIMRLTDGRDSTGWFRLDDAGTTDQMIADGTRYTSPDGRIYFLACINRPPYIGASSSSTAIPPS